MSRKPSVIADRIGADHAAKLSAIYGGTRLHIPGVLAKADRLKRALGDEITILIVLHFGYSRLYVPVLDRAERVDDAKVRKLAKAGLSSARIARKLKCSERTVEAKRAKFRTTTQRPNLKG